MAQIHNPEVIKSLIDKAKIQTSHDSVPSQLAEKVVPVLEVAPQPKIQIRSATFADDTNALIHTTHATKETFLMGCHLTLAKDAVNDGITASIAGVPAESQVAQNFIKMLFEPTTAGQFSENIMFPNPILLTKGSAMDVNNSAATASVDVTGIIFFYEVEPLKNA